MEVQEYFVVYRFNDVMGSDKHQALEKVEFKGITPNAFTTEEEAIATLFEEEKTYEEFVILKTVIIRHS